MPRVSATMCTMVLVSDRASDPWSHERAIGVLFQQPARVGSYAWPALKPLKAGLTADCFKSRTDTRQMYVKGH